MGKTKKVMKKAVAFAIVITTLMSVSYAAWWATPGYEWCFANGITSVMTQNALNRDVTNEDFYAIILRYLKLKGITSHSDVTSIQGNGDLEDYNPVLAGMIANIDKYLSKKELTPEEYRQVIMYADHAESNVATHLSLLRDREDAKNFFLYLSLAKYKAATMINHKCYRDEELPKYNNVKYKEIFSLGMKPYFGKITRKEFLVLMFTLLSENGTASTDSIMQVLYESGVLIGYVDNDKVFKLDERISYAELYNFLYRFETFEFSNVKKADTTTETTEENN